MVDKKLIDSIFEGQAKLREMLPISNNIIGLCPLNHFLRESDKRYYGKKIMYWCSRCYGFYTIRKVKDLLNPKTITEIEDGKHEGTIIKVENRTEPYEYTDFTVKLTDIKENPEIKAGFPTSLTIDKTGEPRSGLAIFLKAIGFDVTKPIEETEAIGKKISFLTVNKKTEVGVFARIVPESIKLKK